jgi:hypothetical protein
MNKHITATAMLRIGLAILGVLLAGLIYFGFRWLLGFEEVRADVMAEPIMTTIANISAIAILIASLLNAIAGFGLLARQTWARYLAMILSVVDLFNVPIGTAIGVYTIWALTQTDVLGDFTDGTSSEPPFRPRELARQE